MRSAIIRSDLTWGPPSVIGTHWCLRRLLQPWRWWHGRGVPRTRHHARADVALKILSERRSRNDADRLARFEREAKTLATLNHPHIAHDLRLRKHRLRRAVFRSALVHGVGRGRGPGPSA